MQSKLGALLCCLSICISTGVPALAQDGGIPAPAPSQTDIRGVVRDANGNAVASARVEAQGAVDAVASTDANGAYDLQVPPGVYRIVVSARSFETATQNSLTVAAGGVIDDVSLSEQAPNLDVIGRTSANSVSNHFNTSPASVQTISPQDFEDQGQESLSRMLDEIPGVSTPGFSSWVSGLVLPDSFVTPQMRGAFPYETAQTFDGFPMLSATPDYGFNAGMITTIGLGGIDIVKGPGADSSTINAAVGGTINYRSFDPTPKNQVYASVSTDGYGGSISKVRDTGTVGRLGYVLGYSALNTPGYFNNVYNDGKFVYMDYGLTVNGHQMACYYIWECGFAGEGNSIPYPANPLLSYTSTPWLMCCQTLQSPSGQHSEYGKLVYHLTPPGDPMNATLDVMYSGSQMRLETGGFNNYMSAVFSPPAGYTGSVPAGVYNLPAWNGDTSLVQQDQNMIEANLRTKLGPGYLRVGYLSLYQYAANGDYGSSPGQMFQIWGGIPLGPASAPNWQYFNGQTALVQSQEVYTQSEYEHAHDWIVDYRVPIAKNSIDVSWTQAVVSPDQGEFYNLGTLPGENFDAYSAQNYNQPKQTNNEFRISSSLQVMPQLSAQVSLYYNQYINYLSTLSPPLAVVPDPVAVQQYIESFSNNYSYSLTPRVALAYRLNHDTSLRFSAGGAMVPLPIASLVGGGAPPTFDTANNWWTESVAPVGLKPETSFGYDVGADARLPKSSIIFSTDLYTTTLRNQYMTATQLAGTYMGAPLYTSQLENIGHSRYQGVELSIRRDVPKGLGFVLSGFLERGYPYDLPANFWTNPQTGAAQNLTFIPGVNFNNGAGADGGIGGGGLAVVPYAGGYGEISYRFGKNDSLVRFGAQFYGKYNTYFEPPFFVLSASARYGFTKHLALQLSADNLGNLYTSPLQGSGSPAYANLPPVPLYGGGQTYGFYQSVGQGSLIKLELSYR